MSHSKVIETIEVQETNFNNSLFFIMMPGMLLQVVGYTTSGTYGWQVGSSICMAYLPSELVKKGTVGGRGDPRRQAPCCSQ